MDTPRTDSDRKAEERARDALRRGKNARPTMTRRSSIVTNVSGAADETATARVSGGAALFYFRDTSDIRRESVRFFARFHFKAERAWEAIPGEPNAWKVVYVGEPDGAAAAWDAFARQWWVKSYEYLMNARVGGSAAGGGELGEGAKRRMREARALRLKDGESKQTAAQERAAFPYVMAANGLDSRGKPTE